MYLVKSLIRKKSLFPSLGKKLAILKSGSNYYYYLLYRNAERDLYLAYSSNGISWVNTKLLILQATTSNVASSASLAADITNNKLYVVYYQSSLTSSSEIKAVTINCTTPSSPSLGTPQTVTGFSTTYIEPIVALGYDGGLHVAASQLDIAGNKSTHYVVKSGISVGEPDLTTWSSISTIGNSNDGSNYSVMGIYPHPGINRLVIFYNRWNGAFNELYRSLNTTGAWDGWAVGAKAITTLLSAPVWTDYSTVYAYNPFDIATVPGWGDAGLIIGASGASNYTAYVYDFDSDTGVGTITTTSITSSMGNATNPYCCCTGISYPGDYHLHFYYLGISGFTYSLRHKSYSVIEAYITPEAIIDSHAGNLDRSYTAPVINPSGLNPTKIRMALLWNT